MKMGPNKQKHNIKHVKIYDRQSYADAMLCARKLAA